MPHDVFISYSSIDNDAADNVCSILEQNGIPCWMASHDITPGVSFAEAIIKAIKESKVNPVQQQDGTDPPGRVLWQHQPW